MATQLISMPAPTTTQPYAILIGVPSPGHISMRNRARPTSLNLSAQPEGEQAVTKAILALIAVGVLTAACTVRSERTVVEKPAPVATPSTAVVVTDPPPSTVYVPAR
jgi:hypothetical protein